MSATLIEKGKVAKDRLLYVLEKVEDASLALAMAGLFVMMVLVTANAVGRYQFSSPITGTVEVTELYLMPIIIFMIAASLQRNEGNVRVDLVYDQFRDSVKTMIDLVSRAFTLYIFWLIAYSAALFAIEAHQAGRAVLGPVEFPVGLSWGIMATGLFVFCIRLLIQIAGDFQKVRQWR